MSSLEIGRHGVKLAAAVQRSEEKRKRRIDLLDYAYAMSPKWRASFAWVIHTPVMSANCLRLTREELYRLVWEKPLSAIGTQFGVKPVVVAKTCDEFNVPRPGTGYWSQLAQGCAPEKPPLPEKDAETLVEIEFHASTKKRLEASDPTKPLAWVQSTTLHPVTLSLKNALDRCSPDENGMFVLKADSVPNIVRVTKATKPRALLIVDALFKAVEASGHDLRLSEPSSPTHRYGLAVGHGPETIQLSIVERFVLTEHVPTATEKRLGIASGLFSKTHDRRPSGRLELELHGHLPGRCRRKFSDRETLKLEAQLSDVVLAIDRGFDSLLQARNDNERREREYQAWRQHRDCEERRKKHLAALAQDLSHMANKWAEANQIKGYLREVDKQVAEALRTTEFFEWLEWAQAFANSMDPLSTPGQVAKRLEPPDAVPSADSLPIFSDIMSRFEWERNVLQGDKPPDSRK